MEDKDGHLGVVEPDASWTGTESGPHAVPWPMRMIVWEWLNRMLPGLETDKGPHAVLWPIRIIVWENGEWTSCCSVADKDDHLGVTELDASLAGTKNTPCCSVEDKGNHLGVVEPDGCFLGWNGEWTSCCSMADKDDRLGVVDPDASWTINSRVDLMLFHHREGWPSGSV